MGNFRKILATALRLAALTSIAGVGAVKLFADQNAPPHGAPAVNSDRPSVFTASLSNGVSIGILGIGENPSTGKQWWLANGDLLNTPPYARMQNSPNSPSAGCVTREFSVQVNNRVSGSVDPATVWWEVAKGYYVQSNVDDQRGKEIPGMLARAETVPDIPDGATIHANVAAGKWNVALTLGAGGCGGLMNYPGCPKFVVFSQTFAVKNETHIFYVCGQRSGLDVRFTAIDRAGKPVPTNCVNATGSADTLVAEYNVNLPLKSIREWQLQSRPFDQWMEIRGISLHAGQRKNVTAATSDDQQHP
jgi:hypothetical protein